MSKDLYMEVLENLITDYLDEHPDCEWEDAYELLQDKAYEVMLDKAADMADYVREQSKGY